MIVAASPGRYVALSNETLTVAAAASTRVATGADAIVPDLTVTATPPALTPVIVNVATPSTIVAAVAESETVVTSDEYA